MVTNIKVSEMNHYPLFSKGEIFSAVQAQEQAVRHHIQSIPPHNLLNASELDLVPGVVDEFTFRVPVIRDEDIHVADSGETQVDVRNDPMRLVSGNYEEHGAGHGVKSSRVPRNR